jgi:flagellar P-ring protein FlgI
MATQRNSLQSASFKVVLVALLLAAMWLGGLFQPNNAQGVRLKDVATFGGVRDNQLVGYGLVVGLSGTGDKKGAPFTTRSMGNMLDKMGVGVDTAKLQPKNVASVMVTAKMPVSAKPGARIDVTISSLGDSSSLYGGVLLVTPLKGIDGKVYALAQGPLVLGGFSAGGAAAQTQKNVTTVGSIPNGAMVERGVPFKFNSQKSLMLHLSVADFSTTMQTAQRINDTLYGDYARTLDISTIEITVPQEFANNLVPLLASLENLEISPEGKAKVVVDEKTGTVVLGRDVRLSKVAVAHGNLQIVIQESAAVSQPGPFSQGQTVTTPQTDVGVQEENRRLVMIEGVTLQEMIEGLNAIGATPRDLISILRTLKTAGALHAELEVI